MNAGPRNGQEPEARPVQRLVDGLQPGGQRLGCDGEVAMAKV